MKVLISACLLGCQCNYKGECSSDCESRLPIWKRHLSKFAFIPVCPEQLGGMPSPRVPSELQVSAKNVLAGKGKVVNKEGSDVTLYFIKGANEALYLAKMFKVDLAVLKSKSPSCGLKNIYDGTFSGKLVSGMGICAYLLVSSGYKAIDENEFTSLLG